MQLKVAGIAIYWQQRNRGTAHLPDEPVYLFDLSSPDVSAFATIDCVHAHGSQTRYFRHLLALCSIAGFLDGRILAQKPA